MGKRISLPFFLTWRSKRILSRITCTLETLPNFLFNFSLTICHKYNTKTQKITMGCMKLSLILIMVSLSNIIGAQTSIKGYYEATPKDTINIEVKGNVYITQDSIAAYLYEPIMQQIVLYDIEPYACGYRGKQIGRTNWIYVTELHEYFRIEWKKTKTKLYKK